MSDPAGARDAGNVWRNQPEEEVSVKLEQIVHRRTAELHSSTRSEILISIGAALLLAGVMAWWLAPAHNRLLEAGFAAVAAWIFISLYWFRRRIWRPESAPPDALAATGLEHYRRELERRRDHLRNAWVWHGPLFLACLILASILAGFTFPGLRRLGGVLTLLVLLAIWTACDISRRRRQARELQREIDELEPRGNPSP